MKQADNREAWLQHATRLLGPIFQRRADHALPENVRMACGWPRGRGKRIGECWSDKNSKDGTFEIFVSPKLDDQIEVLQVLVHELVHTVAGIKAGHGPAFAKIARAMALEGKLTATVAGDTFKQEIAAPVLAKLGPYPHAALAATESTGPKKQGTRMLKAFCPECDYTVRLSQKWLDVATPVCPNEFCDAAGVPMKTE